MTGIKNKIKTYVIDLFCGAGGTSTAVFESNTNMEVIWCINHDPTAIRSHAENYPNCIHSTEDIRTFNIDPLKTLVEKLRREDPTCKIALWASLECTNFSNAKNGPKVADSRTLAEDMYRYLVLLDPDFFWVENVVEFKKWGPLNEFNNPIKSLEGVSYDKWIKNLNKAYPFTAEDVLISADYGGVTIRKRLFLQFSKDVNLIGIPVQTHCKSGESLPKWRAVKEVLELDNVGKSIFNRKRPLVPSSHKRIFMGLRKFGPSSGTNWGIKYYGAGGHQDMSQPSATLTTKDRISPVHVCIKQDYGNSTPLSLNKPMGTLTTNPKGDLVTAFVHNPQYGGSNRSIEDPAATIIARQDKAPIGITHCTRGGELPVITDEDDDYMILIKEYCIKHNITDILIRPLTVGEMLRIQGFPGWYKLTGTKTEQKKHIGNSVEVKVGIALFQSIDNQIQKYAA